MIVLRKIVLLVLITISFNVNAQPLTDENINKFLAMYSNDYSTHAMRLIKGFKKFKADYDYSRFLDFKNNDWLVKYNLDKDVYDNILQTNRKYLFDNGLIFLFSNFSNLALRANDLFFALKRQDKIKINQTNDLVQSDLKALIDLFKQKGIEFRPLVRN